MIESNLPTSGPDVGQKRRQILVVDDHEVGRRSLCLLLQAVGYEVFAVKNGTEALRMLESSTTFDFVLTDIRLPDHDGREIVQAARLLEPRPWTAFITGWDLEKEELRRIGVDWVFLKPLNIAEISSKLRAVSESADLSDESSGNLGENGQSSP